MKTVVVDTNILIDFVNGFAPWLKEILAFRQSDYRLVLPTIVIAEYFTSTVFEDEKEVNIANRTFGILAKQDLSEEIAKVLGKLLRRKTYPQGASLSDLIIAATSLYLNAELATRNRSDFAKIPNLRFFDPKSINK